MAEPSRRTTGGRFIRGRSTPELNTICLRWELSNATECLPQTIRPHGDAEEWPALLVTRLSELAEITHGRHSIIKRELQIARDLRLDESPENDPDVQVEDVELVWKRWDYRQRVLSGDVSEREFDMGTPRLDAYATPPPQPPSSKKRRRVTQKPNGTKLQSGPAPRYQDPPWSSSEVGESPSKQRRRKGKAPVYYNDIQESLVGDQPTPDEQRAFEVASEQGEAAQVDPFPPLPRYLKEYERLVVLRQKQVALEADEAYYKALRLERKAKSDLEHTKYEVLLLEIGTEE
ncbi:uncharacterized protein K460DRAFT_390810 [Cucurbitaria berberidis CBS 394.84]|uniref:Uncharacterized protein n=1 Tax=Cucurbitaria berberidis CBS 394.84 TaxID=1168544 RepID=A0A9P4GRV1_9PLEO|nr:uncharacterized protein K460DRAFT_390810 [Cucurbitaria berberidis CBS 394.84]KAF1850276.1 hypothetical protein K460DRAFT_390810 [Cucurbitaria berberidis CBS 394.84]